MKIARAAIIEDGLREAGIYAQRTERFDRADGQWHLSGAAVFLQLHAAGRSGSCELIGCGEGEPRSIPGSFADAR